MFTTLLIICYQTNIIILKKQNINLLAFDSHNYNYISTNLATHELNIFYYLPSEFKEIIKN